MAHRVYAEEAVSAPVNKRGILYISCGIPGSGKSTFLNQVATSDQVIVSRDEIRFSMLKEGEEYFSHETEVFKEFVKQITENINSGKDVYADATHINRRSRAKLTDALLEAGCDPQKVYAIFFKVPLQTCLDRNEKRKDTIKYVPRGVIRKMWGQQEEISNEFELAWEVDKNGIISRIKG